MSKLLRIAILAAWCERRLAMSWLPRAGAAEPVPDRRPSTRRGSNSRPTTTARTTRLLHVLERHVGSLPADPAPRAQVAAAVGGDPGRAATPRRRPRSSPASSWSLVGTDAQVPLLAKLLDSPRPAEIARYTLQAIPGEASLAALRGATDRLQGLPLVGAINSLGLRRDAAAVDRWPSCWPTPTRRWRPRRPNRWARSATAPAAAALRQAQVPAPADNGPAQRPAAMCRAAGRGGRRRRRRPGCANTSGRRSGPPRGAWADWPGWPAWLPTRPCRWCWKRWPPTTASCRPPPCS